MGNSTKESSSGRNPQCSISSFAPKTYGQWMTDLGPMHVVKDLPFSLFETYRENVEGKYWFPNYARSDDTAELKGQQIPVRIVIKWTDFKPAGGPPATQPSSSQ